MYQNLQNVAEVGLGVFIALNTYIIKQELFKMNDLNFQFRTRKIKLNSN